MSTLYITRGLPGSGKTYLAKEFISGGPKRVRINRDDIRREMFGATEPVLSWEQEEMVTQIQRGAAKTYLAQGYDVVIDDLNLRRKYAQAWADFAAQEGAEFVVWDLTDVHVDECVQMDIIRRDQGGRYVGEKVIREMNARFLGKPLEPLSPGNATREGQFPKYERRNDGTLPPAWIVDIDGTLAHMTGRKWFEFDKVGTDRLDDVVIAVVDALQASGFEIVLCSGRGEDSRDVTEEWLRHNSVEYSHLYMRAAGDGREDAVVKNEIFENEIKNKYNVVGVLDDRDQVVAMWRAKGIKCLQVQPGAF